MHRTVTGVYGYQRLTERLCERGGMRGIKEGRTSMMAAIFAFLRSINVWISIGIAVVVLGFFWLGFDRTIGEHYRAQGRKAGEAIASKARGDRDQAVEAATKAKAEYTALSDTVNAANKLAKELADKQAAKALTDAQAAFDAQTKYNNEIAVLKRRARFVGTQQEACDAAMKIIRERP